jgi:hypothetical protein
MTGRAQGGQVVDLLSPKPLIGAMMGLEVLSAVAESTPIPITGQAGLTEVPPGRGLVIRIGVGHG